jgi:hypothetical protein
MCACSTGSHHGLGAARGHLTRHLTRFPSRPVQRDTRDKAIRTSHATNALYMPSFITAMPSLSTLTVPHNSRGTGLLSVKASAANHNQRGRANCFAPRRHTRQYTSGSPRARTNSAFSATNRNPEAGNNNGLWVVNSSRVMVHPHGSYALLSLLYSRPNVSGRQRRMNTHGWQN